MFYSYVFDEGSGEKCLTFPVRKEGGVQGETEFFIGYHYFQSVMGWFLGTGVLCAL